MVVVHTTSVVVISQSSVVTVVVVGGGLEVVVDWLVSVSVDVVAVSSIDWPWDAFFDSASGFLVTLLSSSSDDDIISYL